MAVGVAEAQATVASKTNIGNGRAIYAGTLAFGTAYVAGGDALATLAEPRIPLPAVIETMMINGSAGWDFVFVPGATPKVQAFGGAAAAKGVGVEAAVGQDLSAVTKAQFWLIGPS